MVVTCMIVFTCVLRSKANSLDQSDVVSMIGTLYTNKNVTKSNQKVHWFTMVFFVRRLAFAAAAIFLFGHPELQMIAHLVLTILSALHFAHD